jgi:hypothetical protein
MNGFVSAATIRFPLYDAFAVILVWGLLLSPTLGRADSPKPRSPGEEHPRVEPIQAENVFECLKACNASIEDAEDFCRNLPDDNKKRKALCWSAIYVGKAACQVFCRAEFGPPIRHERLRPIFTSPWG